MAISAPLAAMEWQEDQDPTLLFDSCGQTHLSLIFGVENMDFKQKVQTFRCGLCEFSSESNNELYTHKSKKRHHTPGGPRPPGGPRSPGGPRCQHRTDRAAGAACAQSFPAAEGQHGAEAGEHQGVLRLPLLLRGPHHQDAAKGQEAVAESVVCGPSAAQLCDM